jgi:hypothetical protein
LANARPFTISFPNGRTAAAVQVDSQDELGGSLRALGLEHERPAIVLIGGAGGLAEADGRRVRGFFNDALIPIASEVGASVVDGGTEAGVMRLMGEGRARAGATFPLIGVAAAGTVTLPGAARRRADAAALEAHHTHFVLVPGDRWGDEAPWLTAVAGALAGKRPSVTVLVNGGAIALEDVSRSVGAGRPVFVVTGSGRTADTLAAALDGAPADPGVQRLTASGLLRASDPGAGPGAIARSIRSFLTRRE